MRSADSFSSVCVGEILGLESSQRSRPLGSALLLFTKRAYRDQEISTCFAALNSHAVQKFIMNSIAFHKTPSEWESVRFHFQRTA